MAEDLRATGVEAPGRLATLARPRGGEWLEPAEEVELLLQDEAAGCQTLGLSFHVHPVPDPEEQRVWLEAAARAVGPGAPARPGSRPDAR